jgi:hypothetical protein
MSQAGIGGFPSGTTIRHSRSYAHSGLLWIDASVALHGLNWVGSGGPFTMSGNFSGE